MKDFLLTCLLIISLATVTTAQFGYNSIGVGAVDYVEVPHDAEGSLDAGSGFTFEAWLFNAGGTSNQKVAGKLVNDFKNGFIFGIQDLMINMEVFDNTGTNTSLLAGTISGIGWTHVAGSYEVGGMLTIYVNGVQVGQTLASALPVEANTNPFRIGIAPWDVNALGLVGYVDEVRYWQAVIDEATIYEWMHKDVTSNHPNYNNLSLYHKYNEAEGLIASDETDNGNDGTLSSDAAEFTYMFLPFKGDGPLLENDVQGVWNAKPEATSDIISITATFFDTLDFELSALVGHSDGDYSFDTDAPDDYDGSLSKMWQAMTQGELFSELSFDLSTINITNVTDVVLLGDEDGDFSDATVFTGTLDGNTFSVPDVIFTDGWFYTLGFAGNLTDTEEPSISNFDLKLAPNPNPGIFSIQLKQPSNDPVILSIINAGGQELYRNTLGLVPHSHTENVDISFLPNGMYLLKVTNGEATRMEKLVIEK